MQLLAACCLPQQTARQEARKQKKKSVEKERKPKMDLLPLIFIFFYGKEEKHLSHQNLLPPSPIQLRFFAH